VQPQQGNSGCIDEKDTASGTSRLMQLTNKGVQKKSSPKNVMLLTAKNNSERVKKSTVRF
jgi:hypothetical protein